MAAGDPSLTSGPTRSSPALPCRSLFQNIKFFVLCQGMLQLAQLMVSGYLKGSISTIERRYGFSSQKCGILAAFNEVGNTVLIVFVSFFGSRIHRPRFIGGGALLAATASLIMALPHFFSGRYHFDGVHSENDNSSGLCQSENATMASNRSCSTQEGQSQQGVFPVLLVGQLLLGVGTVPIQPFGISYIDDFASKRNSPLYLGILLAVTSIGPAFGFLMGSFLLRFYVDIDKMAAEQVELGPGDLRWVGAWWLGFLVISCFLFLTSLPYLFFPRHMAKEGGTSEEQHQMKKKEPELTLTQFLKSFPRIALRTLQNPVYLMVVLAQVFIAAVISGLATFAAKFIERQFNQTMAFATMMIGGVNIPAAVVGVVLGGALMRRLSLSERGAARLCSAAVLLGMLGIAPLLLIGCPTQPVNGVFPHSAPVCQSNCSCGPEVFNPVCSSDGREFLSPCNAGCVAMETDNNSKVTNYTGCECVGGGPAGGLPGYALPGTCGSGCSHLLVGFMVMSAMSLLVLAFCQTPSFMVVLRTVPPEDKSFAVGVQYMLFRVLAFLPGPILFGKTIDSTCIRWGRRCGQKTSCHYYNLDMFRQRFLGLQLVFIFMAFVCFLLSAFALRRTQTESVTPATGNKYELVKNDGTSSKEPQNIVA